MEDLGAAYDLSAMALKTSGIETLNIADGVSTQITITATDIQSMVDDPTGAGLVILTDSGDELIVDLTGGHSVDPSLPNVNMPGNDGTYTISDSGGTDVAVIHWDVVA